MEKRSWKLFPTLVHQFRNTLAPEQVSTILAHCLEVEAHNKAHGAFHGAANSSFDRSARLIEELEARHANLQGLHQGISGLIEEYGRELGFSGLRISNSWFNVQRPGSILKPHVHPDSKVSAALCIQADELSSKLFLENPAPFLNLISFDHNTEANLESARFALEPGDLLLFPSWIKHGSGAEPNLSETRIVISINAA